MINRFFTGLKESIEEHSKDLKNGDAFLPQYLKKSRLTKTIFPKVVRTLSNKLNLEEPSTEINNSMPEGFGFQGKRQRVDYVFYNAKKPKLFFEVESLDRAQLYTFIKSKQYKLQYYDGTVFNFYHQNGKKTLPRYFVWFLILPDKEVPPYKIWDADKDKEFKDRLLNPELKKIIFNNPYRFYDNLIKTSACLYLQKKLIFKNNDGKWDKKRLMDFQKDCELVFITCTIKELILSRGKDLFDPQKERRLRLNWEIK